MNSRLFSAFARFVGLIFTLLGAWIFAVNIFSDAYSGAVYAWIIIAGASGAVGGGLFLLSFDGPPRFRAPKQRLSGWVGMLILGLLPWSFSFVMVPLALLMIPTLFNNGRFEPSHKPTTA